jgi:hypothetical protein
MEVTMNEIEKKNQQKPAKMVRNGAVAASIWLRQAPNGFTYYDFSLSRSWKAKTSGREGYSPNFFPENFEQLNEVIREATGWIAAQHDSMQASPLTSQLDY